ncbi:MAG: hypothetical protein AMXMBFR64_61290 [Myxococcales bacterium]
MKLMNLLVTCALSLTLIGSAAAEEFNHPAGFKLWVPDGWTHEAEGEALQATDPDEEVTFGFIVLDNASDIEAALKGLDEELGKVIKDLKAEEPSETKINGLDAVVVDAKGKIEGTAVDVGVALIAKGGKVMLVFGAVESSKAKKHDAAIEKIIKSIK